VVPALAEGLKDVAVEVRLAAVLELANLGPAAKPAVPALTAALKDGRAEVREAAADALKRVRAPAP
jgi:HEAT repeat protein